MRKIRTSLLGFIIAAFATNGAASDSRVLTGGETLTALLQATRRSLQNTLKIIANDPEPANLAVKYCAAANDDLAQSPQKLALCGRFVIETLTSLREIANRVVINWVPGVLHHGDLQVEATTPLGPEGPITFSYVSANGMPRDRLFLLLAHEVSHKVLFDPIPNSGPGLRGIWDESDDELSQLGWIEGRDLINAAAAALTKLALDHRQINQSLPVIVDSFKCTFKEEGFDSGLAIRASQTRLYTTDDAPTDPPLPIDRLAKYESGFGFNQDTQYEDLAIVKTTDGVELEVELRISEPNDCSVQSSTDRRTVLTIRRSNETSTEPAEVRLFNTNPICQWATGVAISGNFARGLRKNITVVCDYLGFRAN